MQRDRFIEETPFFTEEHARLATSVANGNVNLESCSDVGELRSKLLELPGFGPWTVDYIAMRIAHWTDAFPASDVALRKAMGNASPAKLTLMAEPWRPFRAYAAMRLWLHGPLGITRFDSRTGTSERQ